MISMAAIKMSFLIDVIRIHQGKGSFSHQGKGSFSKCLRPVFNEVIDVFLEFRTWFKLYFPELGLVVFKFYRK